MNTRTLLPLILAIPVIPAEPAIAQPWAIYAVDGAADTLVRIDPATGLATDIGPLGFNGSFWGLAFSDRPLPAPGGTIWPARTLFGVEVSSQALYTISVATGHATRIGPTFLLGFWESLTFDRHGELFTTDVYDRFSLDTSSGLATHVPGGFLAPQGVAWSLDLLPVDVPYPGGTLKAGTIVGCRAGVFFALDGDTWEPIWDAFIPAADEGIAVSPDGTIYGIGGSPADHRLWRIDLLTQSAELIGSTGRNAIWGAAVIPSPAPAAAGGIAVLWWSRRRRG
jgi:hypothetical protein